MNNLLAFSIGLSGLACSAEECLCWIIILLNTLTIFYLVFCAYFRVTNAVKVIGYVWASLLTVGTVAVVAIHTCIYSILSAVFSALIIMAVLSVVLNKGVFAEQADSESEEKQTKPLGYYVIHKTDDEKFVFLLYDNAKNAVCASQYKYDSLVEVKSAIAVCRENSFFAAFEDRTKKWVEYVNHPKFVLYMQGGKYFFRMTLSNEDVVFVSKGYGKYAACEKAMNTAMRIARTEKVYFADGDVLPGEDFKELTTTSEPVEVKPEEQPVAPANEQPVDQPAAEEPVEEVAEQPAVEEQPAEQPAQEEPVEEQPAQEEPVEEQPAEESVEEVAEQPAEEEQSAEEQPEEAQPVVEENAAVESDNENKTLWELYAELSLKQRKYFDMIRARAESKEDVRSSESKIAYTVYYSRDKVVRLRIRDNVVEALFFVTDNAFKRLKDGSTAIKETATVIRVVDDEHFDLAIQTVDYKYDSIVEDRSDK